MKSNQRGFTLIELMITVAIVAILASVAYPSYVKYVARAKRSAAQSVMYAVASKQEQYMLNARSYYPADAAPATSTDLSPLKVVVSNDVSSSYDLTVGSDNSATPPTFYVQAVPKANQASNDAKCGTLRLTNTGARTVTGPGTDCW